MKTLLICSLLFSFLPVQSFADSTRNGNWTGFFGKRPLDNHYFIWQEAQFRYNFDDGTMGQILFRFGGLRSLDEKNEVGLIMGYIQTDLVKEYRPTLQHAYQVGSLGEMKISTRERLEFRMVEDQKADSIRARIMLRGQQKITPEMDLVIWDEPFFTVTHEDWTGNRTIDRNRFFIGHRFSFGEMKFETGYMNQFILRKQNITEHILVLYLFY